MGLNAYGWLRKKTPEHLERIRAKLVGNQNAKTHGLYSRTPPGNTCSNCPNTETCPSFKPGNACMFIWGQIWRDEMKQLEAKRGR